MAEFRPKNLLFFGATGTIGRYILNAVLSARDEFERVVVFTAPFAEDSNSDKVKYLKQIRSTKQVEIIAGDITDEQAVREAYKDIDTVISCVGRAIIAHQVHLIKLAATSGTVKWFIPSEYGTDIAYGPKSVNEKPHRYKLEVRACLEFDETVRKSGLKYTYVVTGPYADMYMRKFPVGREGGGWEVSTRRSTLLEKDARISLTTMKDVGTLVLATLRHPAESFDRALRVNSFTTTPALIQAEYERQTTGEGNHWSDVQVTSLGRLRELEHEAWGSGSPVATMLTLRRIWTEGGTLYDQRDNGIIGEPKMTTLEGVVAQLVKEESS